LSGPGIAEWLRERRLQAISTVRESSRAAGA
jgi:hypothetical protein